MRKILTLTRTAHIRRERARAHRRMAYAALESQSSSRIRLERYNDHMNKARRLEGREVQ